MVHYSQDKIRNFCIIAISSRRTVSLRRLRSSREMSAESSRQTETDVSMQSAMPSRLILVSAMSWQLMRNIRFPQVLPQRQPHMLRFYVRENLTGALVLTRISSRVLLLHWFLPQIKWQKTRTSQRAWMSAVWRS